MATGHALEHAILRGPARGLGCMCSVRLGLGAAACDDVAGMANGVLGKNWLTHGGISKPSFRFAILCAHNVSWHLGWKERETRTNA